MKDLLLITPPFTQLNTPYPATAYIKGFLNTKQVGSFQIDLGIEVILALFSKPGLIKLFAQASNSKSPNSLRILANQAAYIQTIDSVVAFLQGKRPTLANRICSEAWLPQASRFDHVADLDWRFGSMGLQDKAKHLATLYLEDISDYIVDGIDPYFGFSRYAERLGRSANSFDELHAQLQAPVTYIDVITLEILERHFTEVKPKLVCFSVPFPGNLYSAFRCAKHLKSKIPTIQIAMGGGFPNTELRSLTDARVFEYFDFISLDDGELPLELIISNILNPQPINPDFQLYKRTYLLENGKVVYNNYSLRKDYPQALVGTPDYADLQLDKYISVIEVANPMHSLWSDGRWNKLTMAHGCYWGKCTFCDISLDYISQYQPVEAKLLVDKMETLIAQTGETGFHFVDEAAPPALMRDVALEILRRDLVVTWWTNIRFEKSFSLDLCLLLQASGCIAVSGGLEVASDRLLDLIQKGVTVAQVAQVTRNFTEANIMVHAYLMYGYPTQTEQETIDSLEMVRQLFEVGVLQSGFWHQFALTAHSPIGLQPEAYGITPKLEPITFANNDVQFEDSTGVDHDKFSFGLKKSLYNFMHGECLDMPLQEWFDFKVPKTSVAKNYIHRCLDVQEYVQVKPSAKLVWIGSLPRKDMDSRNGKCKLTIQAQQGEFSILLEAKKADWLLQTLSLLRPNSAKNMSYTDVKLSYEMQFKDFTLFWYEDPMEALRANGLLVL